MPNEVVLTSVFKSDNISLAFIQSITFTLAPNVSLKAIALGLVLFANLTSGAPSDNKAQTTAQAAPPEPNTIAGPSRASQLGSICLMFSINP